MMNIENDFIAISRRIFGWHDNGRVEGGLHIKPHQMK